MKCTENKIEEFLIAVARKNFAEAESIYYQLMSNEDKHVLGDVTHQLIANYDKGI
jgi:hypothetical protein